MSGLALTLPALAIFVGCFVLLVRDARARQGQTRRPRGEWL